MGGSGPGGGYSRPLGVRPKAGGKNRSISWLKKNWTPIFVGDPRVLPPGG